MKVKSSMFNVAVEDNGFVLLYNSLGGIGSLCKINIGKHPMLCNSIIERKEIEYNEQYEGMLLSNVLVDSTFDEENYREFKKYNALYNSGTNLIIMPTEQCNFRCTYCYENFKKAKMSPKTVGDIKGYILRNASKFSALNIDWFGGEPLCAYDVVTEIMECCKFVSRKAGIPIVSTMTTNGYLLSPDIILNLAKLNVVGYQITIDGIEEIHDKQRKLCDGRGTYTRIMDNLLKIKAEVRTGIIRICIRVNLNSTSINYAEPFFDILKENFEDDNRFSLSLRYVRDLKGAGRTEGIIDDDSQMLNVYKKAALKIPRLLSSHFISMLESAGTCYAGKPQSIVIGSDGLLYKCTVHFLDDRNVVGKLQDNKLQILDKKIANWVQFKNKDSCHGCWYRGACYDGTCPYIVLAEPEKTSCPFEKIHISYILKFLNSNKYIREILQ